MILDRVVLCRLVRARLPEVVLGDVELRGAARHHADTCLTCQAEAAQYRSLARGLQALRHELDEAPLGFVGSVMNRLDGFAISKRTLQTERVALTASAAVAIAAGVALALRRRHVAA
jgi:hypothetical protein